MSGHIEVITGSMFSGKTEELIRRVRRAEIAHQKAQVFKPLLDDRCAGLVGNWRQAQRFSNEARNEKIRTHNGLHLDALVVTWASDILPLVGIDTSVIAIDEMQFFGDDIVEVCEVLANRGIRVILAGLDLDFRGEPFGPMPLLMARAEVVDKLRAICIVCGGEASRSQRLIDGEPARYDDPVIMVGAEEVYKARCRECHEVRR